MIEPVIWIISLLAAWAYILASLRYELNPHVAATIYCPQEDTDDL